MNKLNKQTLLPSIALVVMLALLGGMVAWRLDASSQRNQWVDLVRASVTDMAEVEETLTQAQATLEQAKKADFTGNKYQSVSLLAGETQEALVAVEPLLDYLEDAEPIAEDPLAAAIDPFSMADQSELADQKVVIPGDLKAELAHFSGAVERAQFSAGKLETATEDLSAGLVNIKQIRADQEVWEADRKALEKSVRKAKTALADVQEIIPIEEGNVSEDLSKQITAAAKMLEENPEAPDDLELIADQSKQFTDAKKSLDKARITAKDTAAEVELLETLAAQEQEAEEFYQEYQEQQNQQEFPADTESVDDNPVRVPADNTEGPDDTNPGGGETTDGGTTDGDQGNSTETDESDEDGTEEDGGAETPGGDLEGDDQDPESAGPAE